MIQITIAKVEARRYMVGDRPTRAFDTPKYPFFDWREMGDKETICCTPFFDL
jgi:hypothetical protein